MTIQLGNGDEHHTLELETTGLNVKGKLYLYVSLVQLVAVWFQAGTFKLITPFSQEELTSQNRSVSDSSLVGDKGNMSKHLESCLNI